MRTDPVGLYVHIPFCVKKCNYCDFCSFATEERSEYIKALCREIESYKGLGISVDTLFFGGGTPSLLTGGELEEIVASIDRSFEIEKSLEFTLEANPGTLDKDKLSAYKSLGVNRMSLGLQSIHENELKILGRIHSYKDFLEGYESIKAVGIDNLNVDLMYGIPEETIVSFSKTLYELSRLSPEHISVYGLILEEGTPLYEMRKTLKLPSEDEECDMYETASRILSDAGYIHYEVSNYAKEGRQCRHNLKYWRDEEYIGVGLSAHSYFDGRRFGNTLIMSDYLNSSIRVSDEMIDEEAREYEYVMLRTRLSEGFSLSEYKRLFGKDFTGGREDRIKGLCKLGYLRISNGRLFFTEKGLYVGNSLLTELI